ncbi:GntR family transcriptional regulator [Curtobacterium sp. VKM Ac-2861]|uniref:GntR family transcriptional regulator n=1 Tax=unclassified Curtobacterium TaxID=257496 RepID=UPI000F4A26A2|nr:MULTISPECIES: GntR family transcriptional regulator [unclassified Curtobacterium]NQW91535.1 GntR family transcriptional regulator [Curtobacterium sp. VKM Ac-2861]ROS36113.1 DNA-binding GntR family transcriptional regulator [Curtobacterium sp. PhB78]RPE85089.1 DNA-binding GntR family transcriptional regulator [Curtobacterium sp. PhB137]
MESKPASVLKAIRAEIIAGTLARGSRLKEDALAERFGVSRVPVREALRQLETEGFVESEKFKGVRVADSSTEVVIELMQIRRGLEVLAAELAARRQGGECADLLRAVGREQRSDQEVEAAQSPRFAFHGLVARASGNSRLETMIDHLIHQTAWAFERVTQDEVASSSDDHTAVAGAILRGASVQAGLLMDEHLRRDEAIYRALNP